MKQQGHVERLIYNVDSTCAACDIDRKRYYSLVASGELRTFKIGRRRMASAEAIKEFIAKRERATAEAEGR